MDSFKDVLQAAQSYCKENLAEATYNLYIDGLEPVSFEDSSHITLSDLRPGTYLWQVGVRQYDADGETVNWTPEQSLIVAAPGPAARP